jgi:hypothetical protein
MTLLDFVRLYAFLPDDEKAEAHPVIRRAIERSTP